MVLHSTFHYYILVQVYIPCSLVIHQNLYIQYHIFLIIFISSYPKAYSFNTEYSIIYNVYMYTVYPIHAVY